MRAILRLFSLPYWVYLALALLAFFAGMMAYEDTLATEAEKAQALEQGLPPVVDAADFRLLRHLGPADEVHLSGSIDLDYNVTLVQERNGPDREAVMFVLFGAGDAASSRLVRAAVIREKVDEEALADLLMLAALESEDRIESNRVPFTVAGAWGEDSGVEKVMEDFFLTNGLIKATNFVMLRPYLSDADRVAALAARPTLAAELRSLMWSIAGGLFALGLLRFWVQRRRAGSDQDAEELQGSAAAVAMQPGDVAAADPAGMSPLQRVQARQTLSAARIDRPAVPQGKAVPVTNARGEDPSTKDTAKARKPKWSLRLVAAAVALYVVVYLGLGDINLAMPNLTSLGGMTSDLSKTTSAPLGSGLGLAAGDSLGLAVNVKMVENIVVVLALIAILWVIVRPRRSGAAPVPVSQPPAPKIQAEALQRAVTSPQPAAVHTKLAQAAADKQRKPGRRVFSVRPQRPDPFDRLQH